MRVVAWNVRRASIRSEKTWNYLVELDPDIALLQEVNAFPPDIESKYAIHYQKAQSNNRKKQVFGSAVLVKGKILKNEVLQSRIDWVNVELEILAGNLVAATVQHESGYIAEVVSVYSPAWPVDKERVRKYGTRGVKLENNPDVWVTELLWSTLQHRAEASTLPVFVGGDFNSSETFDYMWSGGPRGNREILDRFSALGYTECLREHQGDLTPTFRNPRDGQIIHQMDHLFAAQTIAPHLVSCRVGDAEQVFGRSLSDHLPIIADFELRSL